ncbi:two-component system response regulator CreB [Rhodoferax sp. WC2427]|uniref:two-component system response regulator CreB n=1 Tax=Rhodoferax sp. WC2427 TaxID=3234144 RepID=UPI0034668385
MPPPHILLLEDDPAIAKTVVYALERAGLRVTHCLLVADALRQLAKAAPEVLVLDIGLPDGSGLDVCRHVRATPALQHLPVLVLSAHGEEIDRVVGLELGADDYVTKPFSPRELVARVRGLLRRAAAPAVAAPPPTGFTLDTDSQHATWQGQPLALTRRELGLLAELLRQPGRVRSRDTLLAAVWGHDSDSADRTVDTHIKTLRAKLQQITPERDPICTHRGMGYSISAQS